LLEVFSAKSRIAGQDGGVVSALLVSGLKRGLFDCAVVVRRRKGYQGEVVVAETVEDVLEAKGTKYLRVDVVSRLKELVERGKRQIALVGAPCQVYAARRLQLGLLEKYPDLELTLVGLFCFEAFDSERVKEAVKRVLGVDLDLAERTQIRRGRFIVKVNGRESSVSVKELKEAVDKRCHRCLDFTAEYADVSVGSVGSEDGFSTVIVRSKVGQRLFEGLDLIRGTVRKEEISKLAAFKKKRGVGTG
jgi:coenzyme F420-reducing hydrogenase beta subunit